MKVIPVKLVPNVAIYIKH